MTPVRRRFLTEPNEPLLLCQSVADLSVRFEQFADASGIPDEHVMSNALSAIPLPNYEAMGSGRDRFADVNPQFMWHPLMWLPEDMVRRRLIETEDGRTLTEIDEVWTLRILIELAASQLYDLETGTWLDILSVVGLDVADEQVVERVAAWLGGAPDDELDAIDITPLFVEGDDDPHWSFDFATELTMPALYASWGVMANELAALMDSLPGSQDTDDTRSIVSVILYTGFDTLAGVPDSDGKTSASYWRELVKSFEAGGVAAVSDELAALDDYLTAVREAYWPHYEALPMVFAQFTSPRDVAVTSEDGTSEGADRAAGPNFSA